jgi:hypothetical protein
MQHAIARQAEAERERRAKIINAEGEYQAASRLAEAGEVIGANPVTLQLRYLQTLREIGASQNSTVVFPMPIDLVKPVLEAAKVMGASSSSGEAPGELGKGGDGELPAGASHSLPAAERRPADSVTAARPDPVTAPPPDPMTAARPDPVTAPPPDPPAHGE